MTRNVLIILLIGVVILDLSHAGKFCVSLKEIKDVSVLI